LTMGKARPAAPVYAVELAGGDRIVVRGDRLAPQATRPQFVIAAGPGEVRPGLINAHDHLFRNHFPRLGTPPYRNAYDWGRDLHARFGEAIARARALDRRSALLFGALKNLLGAVTSVVHHDPWHPILERGFPLRVVRLRVAHSLGFEQDLVKAVAGDEVTRSRPLSLHVAEGTDGVAGAEVEELERRGLLERDLLAVHAIAVSPEDTQRLRRAGAAVIWCPTSNQFLFGRTIAKQLVDSGVDILLGSDSLLTAEGTLLDELRAARATGLLSEAALLGAVGATAAQRLGLPDPALVPGGPADFVVLRSPLLEARPRDVALVVVGGRPRLGDLAFGELFVRCRVPAEPIVVGGVPKLVVRPLGRVAEACIRLTPAAGRILA